MAKPTVGDHERFSNASQERFLRRDHANVLTPLALDRGDLHLLLPHAHDADEQIIERLTVTPMTSIPSEAGKKNAKCPEEVTYRGVNLSIACAKGDLPLVAMLMAEGAEQGLDMLEADKEGNTPLHYAALSENPEVIKFLLRKDGRDHVLAGSSRRRWGRRWGTLLESKNDACETPLLRAAFGGSVTVARALVEAGADVFATDAGKKTIFHNAARNGRLWILAYFLWVTGEMEMEMDHRTQGEAEGCNRGENRGADSRGSASDGNGNGNPSTVTGLGGAPRMPKMRSPEEDSLLHRKDQDGHTALHWACYAGHVGIARLLVESGLDPRTKDPGGKNSLHWGATKGRAEVCRYLVLLGLDPRQPDAEGADAFQLSKNFRSVTQALSLARTMRQLRGEDRRKPGVPVESMGGSTASAKRSEEAADPTTALARRAPPVEMAPQGSKGCRAVEVERELRIAGDSTVPLERRNPTRAWIVGAYSIPMCGVWGLSFIVPWWVWSLAVILMVAGLVKASMIADAIVAAESGTEPLKSSRGVEAPQRLLLPLPLALLVAPERHLAVWVGIALCFLALSISVAIRLLSGVATSSSVSGDWAFAGASIGSTGDGDAATAVPAWAAWISVGLWVVTLCLWSALIAGNGRRAAAKRVTSAALQKAKSEIWAGAAAAAAAAPSPDAAPVEMADVEAEGVGCGEHVEEPLGMRKVMPTGVCPVIDKTRGGDDGGGGDRSRPVNRGGAKRRGMFTSGGGNGERRGWGRGWGRRRRGPNEVNMMGWGDPGSVSMCPREDMYVLVSEVVKGETGMPDSKKLCQTCLVRKPLRSKHCVECGFCVGRMDHHCVWLNNCVGCGNHRVFMAFVLSQLAYTSSFLAIATISLIEEMPQEGGACGRTSRLLSKQYFPALLLTVTAAGGVLMLTAIAGYQIWNILANMTTNERLNARRYPWLKASDASGARFNRYDQGPWGNLIEFFGLTGKEGDEAQGGRRRCPRDYLEGYELPPLDARQEAKLEALLSKHAARRESDGDGDGDGGDGGGGGGGGGGMSSVVSVVSVESRNHGAQGSSAPNHGGGGGENPGERTSVDHVGGESRRITDKAISCPPARSDGGGSAGGGGGGGGSGGGCVFGKSARGDSLKRLSERGGKAKRAGGVRASAGAGVGVLPVARCAGRSKARERWSAVGHDNDMDCDADVDVDVGVICDADAGGNRGFALSAPASLYADGAALHRQRGCGGGSDGTTSLPGSGNGFGSGNGYMHCDNDNGGQMAKSPVGAVVAAMRFAPVGAVGCGSLPKIESDVGTDEDQSQHSSFAAVV